MRKAVLVAAAAAMSAATVAGAEIIVLGDDDYALVALDFTFSFYGVDYTELYVGSNGFITFVSGDTDFSESLTEFLADQPRIAPFWDDLSPNNGGTVDATGDVNSMVITYTDVPEYLATGANTVAVTLFANGNITLAYGDCTLADAIVGISPGGDLGNPGLAVDFSASPVQTLPGLGGQAIYEQFTGDGVFDLSNMTISFVPAPGALALLGLAGLIGRRRR